MEINSTNNSPNFGAIMLTPKAVQYIEENFSNRAMKKFEQLMEQQKDNPLNVSIGCKRFKPSADSVFDYYTRPCFDCDFLEITAGDKTFNNLRIYHSTIGQIKKAIKYLSEYEKAHEIEISNAEIPGKLLKIDG